MNTYKLNARVMGGLFLLSTAGYASGNMIIDALRNAPDYLTLIAESRSELVLGSLLMLINCFAVVGIALAIYPLLKKHSEALAATYLSFRVIESVILIFGVISYFSLLTLSQQTVKLAGADNTAFQAMGIMAQNGNFYAFQVGMLALSVGSFFLCYSLYKTKILPRFFAIWGFVGYAALLVGSVCAFYGINISMIAFIPGGLFELCLPFWLFFKGFDQSAVRTLLARTLNDAM